MTALLRKNIHVFIHLMTYYRNKQSKLENFQSFYLQQMFFLQQ